MNFALVLTPLVRPPLFLTSAMAVSMGLEYSGYMGMGHRRSPVRWAAASSAFCSASLLAKQPAAWLPKLKHAGAIFMGRFASESLGDYCAGPNHVLPTSGTARFSSPLGVYDFQKRSSLIEVSEAGAQVLGPIAAELAYGEGLQAHAQAAELRLV